jgi:hypothetical protein
VPPKNDIDFLEIFSWENILVKSPYYEKGKKGGKNNTPLVSPTTQPRSKNNPLPFPIPNLIKFLYFSSSLKPHI